MRDRVRASCGKVFGGEVTGFEHGYSEHGGQVLYVTVSGRLHRLRNAVRSESYERKTAGGFVAEMLDRYGFKADIEDFGPETEVSVHHMESDWDFLMEHAKQYGRSVYEWDGTVHVRNEITVSQEDIVLEFGKSMISFRVKESLEGQISKCTFTGWNMMKAEEITGSAEVGEVSVKAGGGTSWADEARILPGMWESVIGSQEVRDAEDARNRALGTLQNASMEWQRAEARCEGDHRIRPGMRVTLKNVGERFSGEYVAERVEHEFGVDGFITEVHLRRNMLPGEPKRTSAIDEERERNMRNQIRNMNAGRQNKTDARVAMFHVGKNMEETKFTDTMDDNDFNKSGEKTSSEIIENSFKIIRQFEFTLNRLYIPIEGIGVITGSLFSVSCIFSNNSLKLFASGWYIGKNLVDSYTLSGTATLFVNGLKSGEKSFVLPDYNYLPTGEPYQTIGDAVFSRHFSKSDKIQIVLKFALQIYVDGGINKGFYLYPSKRISI